MVGSSVAALSNRANKMKNGVHRTKVCLVVILTQDSWVTGVTLVLEIWRRKKEDKNPTIEEDIFPKIAIAECKWFANIWSDAMMQVQIDRWFADTRKVKV